MDGSSMSSIESVNESRAARPIHLCALDGMMACMVYAVED
jgi:hypothetical protein